MALELQSSLTMLFKAPMVLILLSAALLPLGTGCDGCLIGESSTSKSVECTRSDATGTITNSGGAALTTFASTSGQSCMDREGDCAVDARVLYLVTTDSDPFVDVLLDIFVPAGTTPTYDLPASGLDIQARLCPKNDPAYQCAALRVIGGRIVVEENNVGMVSISLMMTLETAAHDRYSVSGGSATISGCRVEEQHACYLTQTTFGRAVPLATAAVVPETTLARLGRG